MGEKKYRNYGNEYAAINYDRMNIHVPKGEREGIKEHAEKHRESLNAFVVRAIRETMARDEQKTE